MINVRENRRGNQDTGRRKKEKKRKEKERNKQKHTQHVTETKQTRDDIVRITSK